MTVMQKGVVLVNLGTPDSPKVSDVRRYLREFLSDPRVIDIPTFIRCIILYCFILPFRPKQSAEAYVQIWTKRGSPLKFHAFDLAAKVQQHLGPNIAVEVAMRYQNPSIAETLKSMRDRGVDEIILFPLFPQYSSAAWGSAVAKFFVEAAKDWNVPSIQVVPPYYEETNFISSLAAIAKDHLDQKKWDKVLMSFHGVPERHCTKTDKMQSHCLKSENCCGAIVQANRNCYRAQCFATARKLAKKLDLSDDQWTIGFQSRLGRTPWIKPYTDHIIDELANDGVKHVAVLEPSFTADCLETLEEIAIRGNEQFREAGGEELWLVPTLNSDDRWAKAVVDMMQPYVSAKLN